VKALGERSLKSCMDGFLFGLDVHIADVVSLQKSKNQTQN